MAAMPVGDSPKDDMSVLKLRNHSPLAAPGVNPVDGTEPSFHVSLRFEPASRPFSRNQMTWTTPSDRSGQRELLTLRVVQMYLCDAGVPPPLPRVHLENLQDAHELLLVRTVPIGRLRHPYLSPLKRQRIIELDLVVAQLLQQVSLDSPELGESRGPQVHGEGCALHAIVGEMPLRSTEARDNADLRSSGIEREGDLVADSVLLIPLDPARGGVSIEGLLRPVATGIAIVVQNAASQGESHRLEAVHWIGGELTSRLGPGVEKPIQERYLSSRQGGIAVCEDGRSYFIGAQIEDLEHRSIRTQVDLRMLCQ